MEMRNLKEVWVTSWYRWSCSRWDFGSAALRKIRRLNETDIGDGDGEKAEDEQVDTGMWTFHRAALPKFRLDRWRRRRSGIREILTAGCLLFQTSASDVDPRSPFQRFRVRLLGEAKAKSACQDENRGELRYLVFAQWYSRRPSPKPLVAADSASAYIWLSSLAHCFWSAPPLTPFY